MRTQTATHVLPIHMSNHDGATTFVDGGMEFSLSELQHWNRDDPEMLYWLEHAEIGAVCPFEPEGWLVRIK